ncbi:hypothetical protein, partial [Corynebacterium sp. 13CS0277]|uniref:hypothetical protein n=1 Tax=Corynebacterium sp. 13CS0277 TaxID=2071994 RepID=UPI0011B20A0B
MDTRRRRRRIISSGAVVVVSGGVRLAGDRTAAPRLVAYMSLSASIDSGSSWPPSTMISWPVM